uniref:Uncharacterized protein n=1 Tax=Nelumbo nucifera TaxID=4432 RepID=A0A822Y483_NELNU|nr:TPA_asm: hypothetical protein HUJ06_030202 [Nelumbo nucifera]
MPAYMSMHKEMICSFQFIIAKRTVGGWKVYTSFDKIIFDYTFAKRGYPDQGHITWNFTHPDRYVGRVSRSKFVMTVRRFD